VCLAHLTAASARNFGYDALQRLVSGGTVALPETYSYDAEGNRLVSHLSAAHTTDAGNRLIQDDTFDYTYDDNGNLASKTDRVTLAVTSYTYDAQDQLIRIDFPDTTFATYAYDALGRRIAKDVDDGAGGREVTAYVYDGPRDNSNILMEFDGTGAFLARYAHGDRVDQPLAMSRGGQDYYVHTDHQGSVIRVTDSVGAVVNSYEYDAYGRRLTAVAGVEIAYGYTGREYDAESGLMFYRARTYDPATGRFLQTDPLGFTAGDANLYRYVGNKPVNFRDPSGLLKLSFDIDAGILNVDPEGVGGGGPFSTPATSGREGECMNRTGCSGSDASQDPECQPCPEQKGIGPIPPGDYQIDAQNMSDPSLPWDILRTGGGFGADWGDWRIRIDPLPGTNTFGRDGFYLHGGRLPGSAGCIDIGGGIFGNDITDQIKGLIATDPDGYIPLTVK
jgi:RHS repeat-associated protein